MQSSGCRVCIEIGHSKPDCDVLDLYTVDDPEQYLNPKDEKDILEQRIDIEDGRFFGSFNPVPNNNKNGMKLMMKQFDGEDEIGDKLLDDDDQSDSVKSF